MASSKSSKLIELRELTLAAKDAIVRNYICSEYGIVLQVFATN